MKRKGLGKRKLREVLALIIVYGLTYGMAIFGFRLLFICLWVPDATFVLGLPGLLFVLASLVLQYVIFPKKIPFIMAVSALVGYIWTAATSN